MMAPEQVTNAHGPTGPARYVGKEGTYSASVGPFFERIRATVPRLPRGDKVKNNLVPITN